MKLKNKIAVTTGAGRGLGRYLALAFAEAGADLALIARSKDQLEIVAKEVRKKGRRALVVPCDVSSPSEVYKMSEAVEVEFGRVDILINNAGISQQAAILDSDDEVWLQVIKVNLYGAYLCIKAILPLMQKSASGSIINIASTAAKDPKPYNTAYGSSKHGLLGLSKSVAAEVALSGYPDIRVNAICPFFAKTDIYDSYLAREARRTGLTEAEVETKTTGLTLQRRILDPEEVADLATFLASDAAKGITGQAINICGGKVFH